MTYLEDLRNEITELEEQVGLQVGILNELLRQLHFKRELLNKPEAGKEPAIDPKHIFSEE